ncbi:MAG: alcohol dehydrogenase catalytic domain-containing protein [Spirosomaceae bacterium]|nr:alcohol dehydrogenase catalytic domain-containing protein [Spirosomataceae bacterium]
MVRNECTALCKSDLHTYTGKRQEKTPTILGHEIVGRIVAFGEDAQQIDQRGQPLALNDRISWAIFSSDPASYWVQKGIPQKGDKLLKYGHELLTQTHTLHGGLSDYTICTSQYAHCQNRRKRPRQSGLNCELLRGDYRGGVAIGGRGGGQKRADFGRGNVGLGGLCDVSNCWGYQHHRLRH